MSELSKLLVKLSKEGFIVELVPWQNPMHCNNDVTGIRIKLYWYKQDKMLTGVIEYTELKCMIIDGIEQKINELYETMMGKG